MRRMFCPKCGGRVIVDRDEYGWYQSCLHCGFQPAFKAVELPETADAAKPEDKPVTAVAS